MAVIAVVPATGAIEVFSVDEGASFDTAVTLAVHSVPTVSGDQLTATPLLNGKLLMSFGGYFPWGYYAVFLSVMDLNDGFIFDVVIPTGDQVDGAISAVVMPGNNVLFKTLNKVWRWDYLAATITELAYFSSVTQHITMFYDGSGFCIWDDATYILHCYDQTGAETGTIAFSSTQWIGDGGINGNMYKRVGIARTDAIPYTEDLGGGLSAYGVYDLTTRSIVTLYTEITGLPKAMVLPDVTGTTVLTVLDVVAWDGIAVYRVENGVKVMEQAVPSLSFGAEYCYPYTNGSFAAITEVPGAI